MMIFCMKRALFTGIYEFPMCLSMTDVLIYLLYSTYKKEKSKSHPWYEELLLSVGQQLFLKRLLKLAKPYQNIDVIIQDLRTAFICD